MDESKCHLRCMPLKKKKSKNKTHTRKPSPCIMLYGLGKVNIETVELS